MFADWELLPNVVVSIGHVSGQVEVQMIILGDLIHSPRLMAAGKIMVRPLYSLALIH